MIHPSFSSTREASASKLTIAGMAVSQALGGPGIPCLPTLLARGPEVSACIGAYWLRGEALDPVAISERHGIGINMAHALAAAVEDLDPFGIEVETVRIESWLLGRPEAAPFPTEAGPDLAAEPVPDAHGLDGLEWFAAHPGRRHRVRRAPSGDTVARLVQVPGEIDRLATLPLMSDAAEPAGGEDRASRSFSDSAMAWLRANQPDETPDIDVAWFSTREDRRHRIRPALPGEIDGRDPLGWAVIASSCPVTGITRLVVDEAALPPSDRGEADLAGLIRTLASDLAAFAALGFDTAFVERTTARPFHPKRLAKGRLRIVKRKARPTAERRTRPAVARTPRERKAPPEPAVRALAVPPPSAALRVDLRDGPDEPPSLIRFARWSVHKADRARAAAMPSLSLDEAHQLIEDIVMELGNGPIRVHEARAACALRAGGDGFAALAALKHHGFVRAGWDGRLRILRQAVPSGGLPSTSLTSTGA